MEEILMNIVDGIKKEAESLFLSRELVCSEAVLVAVNQGFNLGLDRGVAINMMSGFPVGIGNGCLCGAVSGGVAAFGLALGKKFSRAEVKEWTKILYEEFIKKYKCTCCKVLIKDVKDDPKKHFKYCGQITADMAEITARLILERRPELMEKLDGGISR